MGLGALAKAATKTKEETSLKKLLREQYKTVEDISYLTAKSWIRASKFPTICPREEVLCSTGSVARTWEINADLHLIFQHGHGLHDRLQNHILPAIKVLQGKWICLSCGDMYGGPVPEMDVPVESWAVLRPDNCDCGGEDFRFHEVKFCNDEYRFSGHQDGFLSLPQYEGLGILEAKSIKAGWQIQNVPKLEHAIQVQSYLWLTGLEWGVILYWIKGDNGLAGLVEHHIDRDEDTISNIKNTLRSIWDGLDGGPLPDRICPNAECPRAKKCVVSEPCFATPSGEVEDGF